MIALYLLSIPPIDEIVQMLFIIGLFLFGVCFFIGCILAIIWLFLPNAIQGYRKILAEIIITAIIPIHKLLQE